MKKTIQTQHAPAAIGPYTQAIEAGGFVYTSGQIAIDPATGDMVQGGIETQATQAMNNLKAVLDAAGLTLDDVIKTTVFVNSLDDFAAVNAIYARFFSPPFPARSCIEATRLPKDALIEIEAVALCK